MIISLASHGKRLTESAYRAVCTLLDQTIEVPVYLYSNTSPIPPKLRNLRGLVIREVDDLRSYSKLVWALREFPNEAIATADDDIYYPRDWLEKLVNYSRQYPDRIISHRAHSIGIEDGKLMPYRKWLKCVNTAQFAFPTGGGGALYPPNSLYKDAADSDLFMKLCPTTDDVWFWAMAVLNDTRHGIVLNGHTKLNDIYNTEIPLSHDNVNGGINDKSLQALINYYPKLKQKLGLC